MGRFSFLSWESSVPKPISVERDVAGNWWTEIWNSEVGKGAGKYGSEKAKVNAVMTNPAALRVWKINADLGSLGKVNQFQDDKEIEKDVLYSKKKKPNYFQSWTQFIWDYYFWVQFGTAYMYRTNNVFNESTQLYWLNPANIDWNDGWKQKLTKFVFSTVGYNDVRRETIKYKWEDGTSTNIPLKDITPFFDLSNGIGCNWYKGTSDLDALYKVINNSELSLDATAINLEFSQKFMVSGKGGEDIYATGLGDEEKQDIERKVRGNKRVHAVKAQIDIKRFVDNIANLKISEQFYDAYFTIGAMKGISRDVLELSLKGNTYENKEKAIGQHVEYALKPKGQMLTDAFEELFDWQDLRQSWNHLSCMQVFEKDKAEKQGIQLDNIQKAKDLGGLTDQEAAEQTKLILSM